MVKVTISAGNSKMGPIKSISLPPIKTCRKCGCWSECYANRYCKIRKTVRESYENNLHAYLFNEDEYWREIEKVIKTSKFFRFHVAGDIPDYKYMCKMIVLAVQNPECEMLCFTKRHEYVNAALNGIKLPKNLHIILSFWSDYTPENPHNLPTAHVKYKDGTTTASENAKECKGNCMECALTIGGCWTLKNGEEIVFKKH